MRPTAIIRAATAAAQGDDDDQTPSRTIQALNGISLEGLRRLLSSGAVRIRRVPEEDDEEEDEEDDVRFHSLRMLTDQ